MIGHLSGTDIATALVALFAAVLAATKDILVKREDGKGHTLDFNKLNLAGRFAIGVATIAFVTTLINTNKTRASAKEQTILAGEQRVLAEQAKEELRKLKDSTGIIDGTTREINKLTSQVLKGVEEQLPERIRAVIFNTVQGTEKKLSGTISDVSKATEKTLTKNIDVAIGKFDQASIDLGEAVAVSQQKIDSFKHETEKSLTATTTLLEKSQKELKDGFDNAQKAVTDSAKAVTTDFNETIGAQIVQIPLQVKQRSIRRLPGRLSDLSITVGDVSESRGGTVTIAYNKSADPNKIVNVTCGKYSVPEGKNTCWIKPEVRRQEKKIEKNGKKEDEPYSLSFVHNKHRYEIEMSVLVSSNLFGKSPDYLICRVIEEKLP